MLRLLNISLAPQGMEYTFVFVLEYYMQSVLTETSGHRVRGLLTGTRVEQKKEHNKILKKH